MGLSFTPRAPRRRRLPPREAQLRRRLTPLAAGCCARVAWSYCTYCPALRSLASLASDARETRGYALSGRDSCGPMPPPVPDEAADDRGDDRDADPPADAQPRADAV